MSERPKTRPRPAESDENLATVIECFGGALDRLPIYIFQQNERLEYTWLSKPLSSLLEQDILGATDADLLPADEAADMEQIKRRVLETGEPSRTQASATILGIPGWFDLHVAPHIDSSGKTTGIIGVAVDISSRIEAENERRATEQKYRQLFEESSEPIGITTREGEVIDVNPACCELFGYSREEMLNMSSSAWYVDGGQRKEIQRILERDGSVQDCIVRAVRKDGKEQICQLSVTRIHNQERDEDVYYTFGRDITERIRLQRDILRIQEDERRRIGRDLHDGVGTQLSAISLLLSAIERDITDNQPGLAKKLQQVRAYVQEADKNAKSISTGLNPVPLEQDGLAAALERLTAMIEHPPDVTHSFDCDRDIPDLPGEVASHLYWIAQEAITNARKYANADELSLALTCGQTELTLRVSDDGDGFEKSTNHLSGLGLRTMSYRAELLGGTLSIDTALGKGTTVTCKVPLD